ncbi:unnamed protein product [Diplocarpon coronariae]|uniref:BTB domain-containing protein n=1 Tax=Diplocarpon coronariae TaxID=2795749 RepID=A0A218ZJX8_9HELO|nr:hypothetical protein JHW43_005287 [Diplocarpon mali]OWP07526.1 hypothetical protein B2J93_8978 [Marssonina coronariae]
MTVSDSSSEPPVKRQKIAGGNRLLKDLPVDQFLAKTALFAGPQVTVVVAEKEFALPKALLCYSSRFFDAVFKGEDAEGGGQKTDLPGCSSDTFGLAVQWMYQSQVVVPTRHHAAPAAAAAAHDAGISSPAPSRQSSEALDDADLRWFEEEKLDLEMYPGFAKNGGAQTISRLLSFLTLAERIELLGPFDSVFATIKCTLATFGFFAPRVGYIRTALMPGHIRVAAEMPGSHPVRKLFADACFREFMQDMFSSVQPPARPFRFDRELKELDSFGTEMLVALRAATRSRRRQVNSKRDGVEWIFHDPLNEKDFKIVV